MLQAEEKLEAALHTNDEDPRQQVRSPGSSKAIRQSEQGFRGVHTQWPWITARHPDLSYRSPNKPKMKGRTIRAWQFTEVDKPLT